MQQRGASVEKHQEAEAEIKSEKDAVPKESASKETETDSNVNTPLEKTASSGENLSKDGETLSEETPVENIDREASSDEISAENEENGSVEESVPGEEDSEETAVAVEMAEDGWAQDGDNWYYYENGEKVTDSERAIYDADGNEKTYRFDENGNRLTNAWHDKCYYGEDGAKVSGIAEIDGEGYYFDYYGLATDRGESVWNSEKGEYASYYFDSNGHMVTGWYQRENSDELYCYNLDGSCVEGIQKIDGKTYYFLTWGGMQKNTQTVENGVFYILGDGGDAIAEQDLEKDGWFKIDGSWYYAKDKNIVCDDFVTVGNDTYYLSNEGKMFI